MCSPTQGRRTALCAQYAGYYALDDIAYVITHRDGRLFTRLSRQPELEIFPEDVDRFFYKAVQAQITFIRKQRGDVTGLVLHQHGYDHDAPRIEWERGVALEEALADRIRQNQPVENGRTLLRLVIEDLCGEPDDTLMIPALAELAREAQGETGMLTFMACEAWRLGTPISVHEAAVASRRGA